MQKITFTDKVKKAIDLAFGGVNNYKYHYKLMGLDKKTGKTKLFMVNPGENLIKSLKEIQCPDEWDMYIGANPYKKEVISYTKYESLRELGKETSLAISRGTKWKKGAFTTHSAQNVFSLKNLVLDLDFHEASEAEIRMFKDAMVSEKYEYYKGIFEGLPTPNIINFTGRGFQFWWCLKESSKELEWLYKLISSELTNRINDALENCMWLPGDASIDKAASNKIAGLYRMFGTKNSKSSLQPEPFITYEKKYTLDELKNNLQIKTRKYNKSRKRTYYNFNTPNYSKKIINKRIEAIKAFCKYEKALNLCSENRHIKLHLIYNLLYELYGNSPEAKNQARDFNNKYFNHPLPNTDIMSCFRNIDRKGGYKYKTETIIEKLGGEDFFKGKANLFKGSTPKRKSNNDYNNKKYRDINICQEYVDTGSYVKAAKAGKVCRNTAKSVVCRCADYVTYLLRRKQYVKDRLIFSAFIRTKKVTSGAKPIIEKYLKIRRFLVNIIKENIKDFPPDIWERMREYHGHLMKKDYAIIEYLLLRDNDIPFSKEEMRIALVPYLRLTK